MIQVLLMITPGCYGETDLNKTIHQHELCRVIISVIVSLSVDDFAMFLYCNFFIFYRI